MDKRLRELERAAFSGDYKALQALTIGYVRARKGYCLFWIGASKPCGGAIRSNCSTPNFGLPLGAIKHFCLLAIDGLTALENYLELKPHGIVNLETEKYTFFNTPFQLRSPRRGRLPGMDYLAIGDGLYDIKTVPSGDYYCGGNYIEELTFFRGCPRVGSGTIPRELNPKQSFGLCSTEAGGKNVYLAYPTNYVVLGISLLPMPETNCDDFIKLISKTQFRFAEGPNNRDLVRIPSILTASMPGAGECDLRLTISTPVTPILSLPEQVDLFPQYNFLAELIPLESFKLNHSVELLLSFHGYYYRERM